MPFEAPPVNPSPNGLYAATQWAEIGEGQPSRHLNGVEVKGPNYGGESAFGVWDADWCTPPQLGGPRTEGERPDILPPSESVTVWSYDECDLTGPSRAEVQQRAAQIFRLQEQTAVEREVANRLLLDAGTPETRPTLKEAVAYLEGELAKTNTLGFIHAGADQVAREAGLFIASGTARKSPLGHTRVLGGGYVEGLGDTLVATSQPFGWRDQMQLRTAMDERHNIFAAIAERSVLIG
ncbi:MULTISPECIES: hypothetical protein [unclassified Mycolicibacterium]|uniref:hypothetical protein n=1 Tax=unclassified Mycolicibacterium TaxID=2636767 RepID=UPI002ED8A5EC